MNYASYFVVHDDRAGCIANVANWLAQNDVNIGHMEVSRRKKANMALMVIEVDQNIDEAYFTEINGLPHITKVSELITKEENKMEVLFQSCQEN